MELTVWLLGLLGALIGIATDAKLYRILLNLFGPIRQSFSFFFGAAVAYLLSIMSLIFFVLFNVPMTRPVWGLIPALFLVASVLWTVSMYKFAVYIKESSE